MRDQEGNVKLITPLQLVNQRMIAARFGRAGWCMGMWGGEVHLEAVQMCGDGFKALLRRRIEHRMAVIERGCKVHQSADKRDSGAAAFRVRVAGGGSGCQAPKP